MHGKTYPYLDLAALSAVGETLLDSRPAFVFSADGTRLIFANVGGAAFFDERRMDDLLKRRFSDLNPIKSQVARLARILPTESSRLEILRIGQGVSLATLPAACRRLNLVNDERAVLAIGAAGSTSESLTARAERLVDAIAANNCLAAALNAEGKVLAASGDDDELASAESAIDAMIAELQTSTARVVKRPIAIKGGERPAGVVRFRADGRDCFLLIVESVEAGRAGEASERRPTETPAASPSPPPFPAEEPIAAIEIAGETFLPPDDEEDVGDPLLNVVRFVFEMDGDGRFTFVSPELAEAIGEENAAIRGRRWADIADAFGTAGDPVAAALAAGTRFSVALAWPVSDDQSVPVELTADPMRAPDRSFVGYRGFGLALPDEPHTGPNVKRLRLDVPALVPIPPPPPGHSLAGTKQPELESIHEADDLDEAAQKSIEQGLRVRVSPRAVGEPKRERPSNIVRLPGPQPARMAPERLTGTEREAFRRIAEALGTHDEHETPSTEVPTPPKKETATAPAAEIDTRLLDRLPIGIAIFRDRKTLFANRTLFDLLGYESADAFLAAGGAEAIFPGAQGLAGNIAEAGGKLAARRRDGETLPVTAWLHAVTFGGATALMLSLNVSRDRPGDSDNELTVELARSEARSDELEAILDTATDGVIVIDGRGKIGNMNRAAEALFGIEASQFLGRYFTDLLADESQKAALDYLDGLASNGVASVLNDGREVIGRVPQGGLIPLFMTMGRIGASDKFCAVLRDITHWKNVEEELIAARRAAEAANAQKSDFLAKISHEIRTPLNAIIGFSEVMMGERFGPIGNDRYRDYLHDIHVSGAHLMSLINDLLDLSKIEAGKLDLSFEAVPVNATIQECVALMQPQANRERIIIRTSLSTGVPDVVADQRSFRQILLNLMSNAVKFTRSGGQVIVSTTLEDTGEVVVRIRDTGIGMSEKDIQTALKPFRQVAIAKDDRDHGTGLGLPLTKALVEANRATFTIDSVVNQGTLVKVTFPTTRVLAG